MKSQTYRYTESAAVKTHLVSIKAPALRNFDFIKMAAMKGNVTPSLTKACSSSSLYFIILKVMLLMTFVSICFIKPLWTIMRINTFSRIVAGYKSIDTNACDYFTIAIRLQQRQVRD